MEWEDGNEYPVIRLDVSSDSHPFYTGRQKFAAADGRGTLQQKVWFQIKQQLILNFNCLRIHYYGIVDSFYFGYFRYNK